MRLVVMPSLCVSRDAGDMVDERRPDQVEIRLVEYRAEWPELYEREAARIRAVLGERVRSLEHVGSTAVPGLAAKPIIDVCLAVADPAVEAEYMTSLEQAGYVLRVREPEWFQHRLLNGPDTPVNVHVFGSGAAEITRMVCFRDRLRSNPEDRLLYAQTKALLAARTWSSVQGYADAKAKWCNGSLPGRRATARWSRDAAGVERRRVPKETAVANGQTCDDVGQPVHPEQCTTGGHGNREQCGGRCQQCAGRS